VLDSFGLEMLGAFVPVALSDRAAHEDGIAVGVKTARLLAEAGYPEAKIVLADDNGTVPARVSNAGRVHGGLALDAEGWSVLRDGAVRFAKTVRDETGLRTAFHHHCGGYVETPGEIEKLLVSTPADTLGLVLDMGHYRFGGGYPEAAIELFWDRIIHVHDKDCSADVAGKSRERGWDYFESLRHGVFCELGQGAVDFAAVTDRLRGHGFDGWIVVEQDVLPGMGSPKECARRNRDYLASLGL
ncbi:MAG: sugar phosphate isomerase/epimerase family protein, partial [Spirochaetota bacterium]